MVIKSPRILTLEDGTDRLSQNVSMELPLYAAQYHRRVQISCLHYVARHSVILYQEWRLLSIGCDGDFAEYRRKWPWVASELISGINQTSWNWTTPGLILRSYITIQLTRFATLLRSSSCHLSPHMISAFYPTLFIHSSSYGVTTLYLLSPNIIHSPSFISDAFKSSTTIIYMGVCVCVCVCDTYPAFVPLIGTSLVPDLALIKIFSLSLDFFVL